MKTIKEARAFMRKRFEDDIYFKKTYIDNIAMYFYDHIKPLDVHDKDARDKHAEAILDLIFSK